MTARRAFLTGRFRAPAAASMATPEVEALDRVAQIGAACLSTQGVACRMCEEQCDADAIRFRLAPGGRALPFIALERCDGCGACAAPCPVGAVALIARAPQSSVENI